MGRKCAVPECLSEEGREEDKGVTFHKIPLHSDIRPKWMSLCHIPDDKYNIKVVHVCSRHFRRADFCNFKGKKYMLRQGVLPSVFPWNKLKREQLLASSPGSVKLESTPDTSIEIKNETYDDEILPPLVKEEINIKDEPLDFPDTKDQQGLSSLLTLNASEDDMLLVKNEFPQNSSTIEQRGKSVSTSTGMLNFSINSRLEALDFNSMWLPARIIEIDYEEDEVLIHFEKCSSKFDEWISMSSSRLRSVQSSKKNAAETFSIGEDCTAVLNDAQKLSARITNVVDKDTYEVLFNDGHTKTVKGQKLSKLSTKSVVHSAPLFDPVQGTKQERREKKRKLNVSELFKKRTKVENIVEEPSLIEPQPQEDIELWLPTFEQGKPVGIDSAMETADGPKKSIVVPDPHLPPNWQKHLIQRTHGLAAGKWECFITSPEGRLFRCKSEIKLFLEENPQLKYSANIFNFNLFRRGTGGGKAVRRTTNSLDNSPSVSVAEVKTPSNKTPSNKTASTKAPSSLQIPFVGDTYMCPIEGCAKSFRRCNLAQMHVKHYHPQFTKFLDSTPNVADLAYARTVGESLNTSPERISKVPVRQTSKTPTLKASVTPKALNTPSIQVESTPPVTNIKIETEVVNTSKDSEIIKLLNSKLMDENPLQYPPVTLPSGLPPSMYPDIKLIDLLNKSEGIPKRDDLNLKSMSACTTRPTGIKTLLPVVRSTEIKKEPKTEGMALIPQEILTKPGSSKPHLHKHLKRKRQVSEIVEASRKEKSDSIKEMPPVVQEVSKELPPTAPPTNPDYIVEGGEVIKIVRMKREEIINCTCGITEEDGLMIQCEICLCWQHAYCNNIERENQVPEKYVCYICQNPSRQRLSRKYSHDQDWLKMGILPVGNYHCKDNEVLKKRFEKLKKVHDLTGGLLELKDFMHSLKVKLKIAQAKNHPKLYLWSKPWHKQPLAKQEVKEEKAKIGDISLLELESDSKTDLTMQTKSESTHNLLSIFKTKDEDLNSLSKLDFNSFADIPISAPQPEEAIESADCQLNLLEHIAHSQKLVEERLKRIEEQIDVLDPEYVDNEEDYARTCKTIQMLIRDLGILKELCYSNIL